MIVKRLKDYPNYEIHQDGSIWRRTHHTSYGTFLKRKQIKPYKAKNNYLMVSLHDNDGNRKRFYVHRLVYMAFYGEIPKGMEIDHADTNRANNAVSNLRLCSHRNNCNNPTSIERYRAANAADKGKIHSEKMLAARSKKREQELKDLYLVILNEKGKVKLWEFMNVGHCNYYRAARIIYEMQKNSEKMGVSIN